MDPASRQIARLTSISAHNCCTLTSAYQRTPSFFKRTRLHYISKTALRQPPIFPGWTNNPQVLPKQAAFSTTALPAPKVPFHFADQPYNQQPTAIKSCFPTTQRGSSSFEQYTSKRPAPCSGPSDGYMTPNVPSNEPSFRTAALWTISASLN